MLTSVMRASSRTQSLKPIMSVYEVDWDIYDIGEKLVGGRVASRFTVTATISQSGSIAEHLKDYAAFIDQYAPLLSDLKKLGADMVIDTGIAVFAKKGSSFSLPTEIIESLAKLSVSITVSAYPCADADPA